MIELYFLLYKEYIEFFNSEYYFNWTVSRESAAVYHVSGCFRYIVLDISIFCQIAASFLNCFQICRSLLLCACQLVSVHSELFLLVIYTCHLLKVDIERKTLTDLDLGF